MDEVKQAERVGAAGAGRPLTVTVTGDTISGRFLAYETGNRVQTYTFTYVVRSGAIVSASSSGVQQVKGRRGTPTSASWLKKPTTARPRGPRRRTTGEPSPPQQVTGEQHAAAATLARRDRR